MGAFELHLHEPSFTLNTGEKGSLTGFGRSESEPEYEHEELEELEEVAPSLRGKLIPILLLVAVIALVKRRRRR